MRLYIVAIRDIVADAYMTPIFVHNKGGAIREFLDGCKDATTPLGKHPEHYELWLLGEWGDGDGRITAYTDAREQLSSGANA